jgi:protein required for attachment to host cells
MTSSIQTSSFVLVADTLSARFLFRQPNGTLQERWQLYAPDDKVHSLGQSPNTRDVVAHASTDATAHHAHHAFAVDITDHILATRTQEAVTSMVVIAPPRFVEVLRESFGADLWPLVAHSVPRDETRLNEESLQKLVDSTLAS